MRAALFIMLLIVFVGAAHGQAGERVWIIDPDGAAWSDYSSLTALDAAKARDLTAADTNYVAECICTGGTAHGAYTAGAGWTTDATRDIKIWTNPDSSYRHVDGKYTAGNHFRIEATAAFLLAAGNIDYATIEGLQFKQTGGTYDACIGDNGAVDVFIEQCIIVGNGGTGSGGVYCLGNSMTTSISNCVFYGFSSSTSGYGIYVPDSGTYQHQVYAYNCTFRDCFYGIRNIKTDVSYGIHAINCLAQDPSGAGVCFYDNGGVGIWQAGTSYNCSDDNTQPGTNGQNGEVVFTDEGGSPPDLSLNEGSPAYATDLGTDLSGDGDYPIGNVDIQSGSTAVRNTGTWDIGAFDATAAGGAPAGQVLIVN